MERFTEKFKDGRNIIRRGIIDVFHIGFGRFFDGEAVDKLSEYEDLEEQGKLLKLTCNVGNIVYALWSIPTEQGYVVYPAEAKEIRFGIYGNRRTIKYRLEPISYRGRILDFYSDDFGNKLFLEESEAESALRKMNEMEGKHGN